MNKAVIKIVLGLFLFGSLAGVLLYKNKKSNSVVARSQKDFINNLEIEKRKTKKSDMHIALEAQNIEKVKLLLASSQSAKNYKNLIAARLLYGGFKAEFKKALHGLLVDKLSELKGKEKVFALRALTANAPQNKLGKEHDELSSYLSSDDFSLEEKSVLVQGMQSWKEVPGSVIDFIVATSRKKDQPQEVRVAVHSYSLLKNHEQFKTLFEELDSQKESWDETNRLTFLKTALNNRQVLGVSKKYFESYIRSTPNENIIWEEFRLKYYESFSLEKEHRDEIMKIANGRNNVWIKKHAQKMMEKIK